MRAALRCLCVVLCCTCVASSELLRKKGIKDVTDVIKHVTAEVLEKLHLPVPDGWKEKEEEAKKEASGKGPPLCDQKLLSIHGDPNKPCGSLRVDIAVAEDPNKALDQGVIAKELNKKDDKKPREGRGPKKTPPPPQPVPHCNPHHGLLDTKTDFDTNGLPMFDCGNRDSYVTAFQLLVKIAGLKSPVIAPPKAKGAETAAPAASKTDEGNGKGAETAAPDDGKGSLLETDDATPTPEGVPKGKGGPKGGGAPPLPPRPKKRIPKGGEGIIISNVIDQQTFDVIWPTWLEKGKSNEEFWRFLTDKFVESIPDHLVENNAVTDFIPDSEHEDFNRVLAILVNANPLTNIAKQVPSTDFQQIARRITDPLPRGLACGLPCEKHPDDEGGLGRKVFACYPKTNTETLTALNTKSLYLSKKVKETEAALHEKQLNIMARNLRKESGGTAFANGLQGDISTDMRMLDTISLHLRMGAKFASKATKTAKAGLEAFVKKGEVKAVHTTTENLIFDYPDVQSKGNPEMSDFMFEDWRCIIGRAGEKKARTSSETEKLERMLIEKEKKKAVVAMVAALPEAT